MMPLLIVAVPLAAVLGAGMLIELAKRNLAGRGEAAGVPEEPVPDVSREDARAALDAALVNELIVRRRFTELVWADPELVAMRRLPVRLWAYYRGVSR